MATIAFPKVENWVAELTTTQGTGTIQLDGPIEGFNSFSVIGSGEVYYVIENGGNKETGVGTLNGRAIERTKVQATIVNGSYSKSSNPISLVGVSTIYCAANAYQYELMVAAIRLTEETQAGLESKVPLSGSTEMENDFRTNGGFIANFIRSYTELKYGLQLNSDSLSPSIQPVNPDGSINSLHGITFFPSLNKWFANGGEIYSAGNKPKFQDLSDSVFWLQPAGGKIRVGGNTDLTAGRGDKGFLAYQSGTGDSAVSYVGKFDWWFQEAWVNQYRGGTINVTGSINGNEVYDSGERVFSPVNMPTLAQLGAESSTNDKVWKYRGSVGTLESGAALLPGHFQFGPGTVGAPVTGYGHGFTTSMAATGYDSWMSQTVFAHDSQKTMFYRTIVDGTANPWVRVYTDARKPLATEIGAVQGSSKAAFLPAGPTSERPTAVDFPANTRAIRFNVETDQWEGLDPDGNVIPIGGGGVPPFIPFADPMQKRKALWLSMTDAVSKTVTIEQGMPDKEWFALSVADWPHGVAGVTATVDFGNEFINNGTTDFSEFVIDRPCVLYFQKVTGKWKIVSGIGIDGSYNALEKRIEEIESWPQSGSNANGTWVMYKDGRMECYLIADLGSPSYTAFTNGFAKSPNFTWVYPKQFIAPPLVNVESNNASNAWLLSSCATPTANEVLYSLFSFGVSSAVRTVVGLTAKGRWK